MVDVTRSNRKLDSIDDLMKSFVTWYGEVPPEGERIEEWVAMAHASAWIRHNIGRGVVQSYAIGFALENRWWTYFFNRVTTPGVAAHQSWCVEAYNSQALSWSRAFLYWSNEGRWGHSRRARAC